MAYPRAVEILHGEGDKYDRDRRCALAWNHSTQAIPTPEWVR
jgi:hypothetical protein